MGRSRILQGMRFMSIKLPRENDMSEKSSIQSGNEYIDSLRGKNLKVFYRGERITELVDHPVIRPSINAVARTFDLALENPKLASATSSLNGQSVNRFLHITESREDVVMQNKMQRRQTTCHHLHLH